MINRAWNRNAGCRLTHWLKIIPHMSRSGYRCCCINEPVNFSHCVLLKQVHRFHALLKVCTDRDERVPLSTRNAKVVKLHIYKQTTRQVKVSQIDKWLPSKKGNVSQEVKTSKSTCFCFTSIANWWTNCFRSKRIRDFTSQFIVCGFW